MNGGYWWGLWVGEKGYGCVSGGYEWSLWVGKGLEP